MSRLKSMPVVGWFIAGVAVTLLAVPSVAVAAAALKFTGIEGTSGQKADVTAAGQLKVAEADPSTFFQNATVAVNTPAWVPVATPLTGSALIVSVIHVEGFSNLGPITLQIETGSTCTGTVVGSYTENITTGGDNQSDTSMNPGLGVPAGDALCASSGGPLAGVSVSGYTVPAASVPASGG